MPSTGLKIGSVISVTVIIVAILYKRNNDEILKNKLQAVLSGLLQAEKKAQVETKKEPRVAVGFGACLDIFADGVAVLDKVGAIPSDEPEHFSHINDLSEVEKVFSYFFRHGAAAECVFHICKLSIIKLFKYYYIFRDSGKFMRAQGKCAKRNSS